MMRQLSKVSVLQFPDGWYSSQIETAGPYLTAEEAKSAKFQPTKSILGVVRHPIVARFATGWYASQEKAIGPFPDIENACKAAELDLSI